MAQHSELQAAPRLAGYESWLYQMPCLYRTGDVFVSVAIPQQTNHFDDSRVRRFVAIGDLVARGECASRLKVRIEAEITRLAGIMTDPASILTSLNHDLVDPAASETFATLVLAVIDGNRHELTLASAGHVAPFLRDADRRIESLGEERTGFPLWIDPTQHYENVTAPIAPGEIVIFHSGGLTAIIDNQERIFDLTHLRQAINQASDHVASVGQSIMEAIRVFGHGRPQWESITLLCVGRAVPTTQSFGRPSG